MPRPFWSVMVPTYNPTDHLRETLLAARASLKACGATWQLEVVDDGSDQVDVPELLRSWELGDIDVHRRGVNGGLGVCWNTCVARARGDLVHILHQDDLVNARFHEKMGALAAELPQAGMLFCQTEFIEAEKLRLNDLEQPRPGLLHNWLEKIAAGQRLQCPSAVVRRETYERVGGFVPSLRYVIDWEMWVRIAATSEVAYLPEPLAMYRVHPFAETARIKAAGVATRDYAEGLKHVRDTLARANRMDCLASAEAFVVDSSIYVAHEAEWAGWPVTAAREICASLRYFYRLMSWHTLFRQIKWCSKLCMAHLRGTGQT